MNTVSTPTATMANIILPSAFDSSKLTYESVVTLKSGGRSVPIRYNGTPLIIQTPEMVALFGSSNPYSKDQPAKPIDKKTLELSFKDAESKKPLQRFLDKMSDWDKKIKEDYFNKSQDWARKTYKSLDVLDDLYSPLVRYAKDKETGAITTKYAPTFRVNVPFDDKEKRLMCDIYSVQKELIQMCDIDRGSKVTAIIQCTGIWLIAGKFGVSWRVVQLRVVPPQTITGFAFKDVEEDDDECANEDLLSDPDIDEIQPDAPAPEKKEEDIVESSADEESEEDEEEVKKKVVKRITRKKVAA